MEIQFFYVVDEFWQKVSYSIGDYKYVKTGRQCMSLMENFPFFEFPIFRYSRSTLNIVERWLRPQRKGIDEPADDSRKAFWGLDQ